MECNQVLSLIFVIVRYIMLAINIICPILLMISLTKQFIVMMAKPDDKKEFSKIRNSIIALFFVFFIPFILNLVIFWVDDTYQISSCIENASYEGGESEYVDINHTDEDRQSVIVDPSEYDTPKVARRYYIAKLAVALSPTAAPSAHLKEPNANPWNKINDSRLNNFYEVMDLTIGQYGDNNAYASCAQAAGGVIRATADPDFSVGNPELQLEYLSANTEKWKLIGVVNPGESFDEKCEVGDLLVCNSHTMIYVGNELAREKFPNTNGNMFQAGYNEGSHAHYPSIDYVATESRTFYIYRPTGNGDFSHPFISIDKYLD